MKFILKIITLGCQIDLIIIEIRSVGAYIRFIIELYCIKNKSTKFHLTSSQQLQQKVIISQVKLKKVTSCYEK